MSNAIEEVGYRLTKGAIRAFAVAMLIGFLILWAANAVIEHFGGRGFDGTDDAQRKVRSGLRIYHDHGTGCQYLSTRDGVISTRDGVLTPRLNESGEPICGK